ncbi:hypothetical protein BD779DRAFT_1669837 [Infundibulicybe gibba]|nr:hypothetical protein BD779DRAFT_1669837 [Infundibulicybe gibba]
MSGNTALGSLVTTSSTTYAATFKIRNELHTFVGSFIPPMESFAANEITLTYAIDDDLIGAPAFSGEIGIMNASILFSTRVSISGPLNSNYGSKIMSKNATALGSLATTTGSFTTLTATFKIGNKLHTFVGSFTPPMEPFAADKVTLTYATGDDLTGSPAFSGEIGIMMHRSSSRPRFPFPAH